MIFLRWYVLFWFAVMVAGLVVADADIDNVAGSIKFHVEQGGEPVLKENGSPVYFQNPLNAAHDAMSRAEAGEGKTCVVRARQETCFTATPPVSPDTDTGGDSAGSGGGDTGGDQDTGDTGGQGGTDSGDGGDIDSSGGGSGGYVHPAGTALYSYSLNTDGTLVDPKILEGAHLAREITYFEIAGDYIEGRYWCCKGPDETHLHQGRYTDLPLVHSVDINKLAAGDGKRELYTDMKNPDGSWAWAKTGYFTVNPKPQTAEPPVALYSYSLADDGTLIDPKALAGATLTEARFYVAVTGDYTTAAIACCQPDNTSFELNVESLITRVIDVDLRLLAENTPLTELTVELLGDNDSPKAIILVGFDLEPTFQEQTPVTLEWSIPTQRENGDSLSVDELAGYLVEYTKDIAGAYTPVLITSGAADHHDFSLPPDVYQFRVTAIDTDGLKSNPSPWVEGDLRPGDAVALLLNW